MVRKNYPRNYSVDFSELKDMDFQIKSSHQKSSTMHEMTYNEAHDCKILEYQRCGENSKNFHIFKKCLILNKQNQRL